MNKLGDVRIREFIHPDSINVTVWEVEQLTLSKSPLLKEGSTYWRIMRDQIEPFTSKEEAEAFAESLEVVA